MVLVEAAEERWIQEKVKGMWGVFAYFQVQKRVEGLSISLFFGLLSISSFLQVSEKAVSFVCLHMHIPACTYIRFNNRVVAVAARGANTYLIEMWSLFYKSNFVNWHWKNIKKSEKCFGCWWWRKSFSSSWHSGFYPTWSPWPHVCYIYELNIFGTPQLQPPKFCKYVNIGHIFVWRDA